MLYRSNPVLDVLVLSPIMLIVFGAYFAAASVLTNIAGWLALSLPVATVVFMIGLLFLLPRGGGSLFPWGPETLDGPRWEIASLAQLPGTPLTGIQLALRALDTIPPAGAVIVATANSKDLYGSTRPSASPAGQSTASTASPPERDSTGDVDAHPHDILRSSSWR